MFNIPEGDRDNDLDLHRFSRMSEAEFKARVSKGERFVIYRYTLSALVYSVTRPTKVYVSSGRMSAVLNGVPFTIISAVLGWWFITGPIRTISSIIANSRGGIDVFSEILEHIRKQDVFHLYGMR